MNTKHRPDLFVHTLNSLRTGAAEDAFKEVKNEIEQGLNDKATFFDGSM